MLLAFALSPAGCKKKEEAVPEVVATVQAEHPERGEISERIEADAVLSPLAQAALSSKITAPVRAFYVQRGTKVRAGQLLATLENRDLQAAALDNKGAFTAAKATYETQTRAQLPEDLQKAQLDMSQTAANLKLNESIVESRKQLFAQGAIPGRDLDTANAGLVQAKAAFDSAKLHLASIESVGHEAALKNAQGQLTSAEGRYLGAEAQVSYSEIKSPINGVVTDRSLFAGETAAAGAPLLTVMDTSALLAKVHLAQSLAERLSLGDPATITVPGETEPVAAKTSLISPALDPGSTTVEVWLRIDNSKGRFKVGTPVRVSITGRTVADAVKLPMSAILTAQDGAKSVLVIGADNTIHRKSVTLGIQNADDVQILSGPTPGETVVTGGGYGLEEGTKVKVGATDEGEKPSGAGAEKDDR